MAHRSHEITFTLEQRRHSQMHLEISRLAPDEFVVEHQRAQRIRLGGPTRFVEAGAQPRGPEAVFDFAGGALTGGPQQQLPALRLEYEAAVAHEDLSVLAL